MEFLRSLLRRRFARAQVATSRDVGCFLRLTHPWLLTYWFGGKKSLDVSKAGVQCAMENTFDPFLFEKIKQETNVLHLGDC